MFTKYVWKWDDPIRTFHIDNVEVKDKDGEVWLATGTVRLEQTSPNGAWWRGDGECTILDGEEEKEVVFINVKTGEKVTSHCDELSKEYDKWEKLSVRLEKKLIDDGPKTKVFAEKQNPAWIYGSNKSAVISEDDPTHKGDDSVVWIEKGSEEDADYDPDDIEELNENYKLHNEWQKKSLLFERVMRNSR